jgi:transaldolase
MTTLRRLHDDHDQSPWIDFIDRALIEEGMLEELIEQGIRGLTSNPTIFAKAVASGQYDDLIRRMADEGARNEQIYEAIAVRDVGDAADRLRPVFDAGGEADGFVSIELEPALANDTELSIERARELWRLVDRPNIFVKIPGTEAGLPAISQAISEGINVNVTLLFNVDVYRNVARAYIEGLRRRHERGEDVSRVRSVASFFVSRVDTEADKRLGALMPKLSDADRARAAELQGAAAVANAKQAYRLFQREFATPRWAALRERGARVQRPLWASTSTKNPAYRDVMYVEQLIGPHTVNTMPPATVEALRDHGVVARTVDAGLDEADRTIGDLERLGVSMRDVTDKLLVDGLAAFQKSYDAVIAGLEAKSRTLGLELATR